MRILIIDDEENIRRATVVVLEANRARNGERGENAAAALRQVGKQLVRHCLPGFEN